MAIKRTSLQKRRGIDAIFEGQVEDKTITKTVEDNVEDAGQTMIKLTVMVPQYIQWGLDEIQLKESRRTGKKPEKYSLAKEAFDLLFQQYGITGKQENG